MIPLDHDRLNRPHISNVSAKIVKDLDGKDQVRATIQVGIERGESIVRLGTILWEEWINAGSWPAARELLKDFGE